MLAKVPLAGAFLAVDHGSVDGDVFFTADPQGTAISTQVDRITTSARRFAAYRTVTAVKRIGMV
jgi:hypothetical protein